MSYHKPLLKGKTREKKIALLNKRKLRFYFLSVLEKFLLRIHRNQQLFLYHAYCLILPIIVCKYRRKNIQIINKTERSLKVVKSSHNSYSSKL